MHKYYTPIRGDIYTLSQVETELKLRDEAFLRFSHPGVDGGEPGITVIQTSHCTVDQLLAVPGFAESQWRYERETEEWIPLFRYVGERPITDFVDMEPAIDPLRDADMPQEWWVTPKGLPREQYYAGKETMEQFNESMGWPKSQLFEVHAVDGADKPRSFVLEASCRDVAAAEVRSKCDFRVVSVDVFTTGHGAE
jgi:hypothetical protein